MSAPTNRVKFLSQDDICELFWNSESEEEVGASSDSSSYPSSSEDEGGFEDKPGVSHLQPDRATSIGNTSSSVIFASAADKEEVVESGQCQQVQMSSTSGWTRPSSPRTSVVQTYKGGIRGKKNNEAPHINDGSNPLSVFLLYFAEIITLLVVETNRYYHDHLDTLDEGPSSPIPDVTEAEMLAFLALTIQMGHQVRDRLSDYWGTSDQLYMAFFSSAMKRDRYFHILRFLHFTDNKNEPDRKDDNFDKLWKLRNVFEILNTTFSKFYNPSENLAIDEVIVLFKGRVAFKQYIPKKHKRFGIKIYKLCDETGYTYDMKVYVGKEKQRRAQDVTVTHATVTELTQKVQGRGHKLYMDNFFSSPQLFQDLARRQIYCCGTVRPNRKGMPQDIGPKKLKLKRGDIHVRTMGDLTAILWKDKRDVYLLSNIHNAPPEGNFRDNDGKAVKPQIVEDYSRHMGYVDKGDRMANSYSICRRTLKWTKKLFFHLFDLAILNSFILLSSCGGTKISHRDFRFALVRNMLAQAGCKERIPRPLGRPPSAAKQVSRLELSGSKHWPVSCAKRVRCRVCSARGEDRRVFVKCRKCDVGLCVARGCFEDYHTKANL